MHPWPARRRPGVGLLRQDQRQVLTQRIDPKLIMANAILQQSSLELAEQIEAELMDNPALDVLEETPPCQGDCIDPANCPFCSQHRASSRTGEDFREIFDTEAGWPSDASGEADEDYDPMGNLEAEVTLQDHLRSQLRAVLPEEDYPLGEYLINCLDDNGWLDTTVEAIAAELRV